MITAITAAELYASGQRISRPVVLVEDGRILAISSQDARSIPDRANHIDFPSGILVPGFLDLHIHGSAGYDVMEATDSGLRRMSAFLATHGVCSFLATTVTSEPESLISAIEKIAAQILHWNDEGYARPIGIHLEGPCISRLRRGVHPAEYLRNPSLDFFEQIYEAASGTLRLITVAPELPGAIELIREAVRRGVKVSIGHTDGSADDALKAIAAGATHVTHIFNAMRPLHHRAPGVIAEALNNPSLSAEIIADGVHVDPRVVNLFLRCKGTKRSVLVTDAISATGEGDGSYKLGNLHVAVHGTRCECDGYLAGSVLTIDSAVRNVMRFCNLSLAESVRLASENPAAVLGDNSVGVLHPGARADINVLSPEGEVLRNFVFGKSASNCCA